MEHEQEQRHGEAAKCIDEGREEHHRGLRPLQNIEDLKDERPCQEGRDQDRPDESQQCCTVKYHGRSMNA